MGQVLGALFAVLVGLMIIPTFGRYQQVSNDNSRAVATAQQQQQLMNAAKEYIQQNAAALQANATSNTPAIITVSMLQNTNFLPAAFGATNPYGQTWAVQVLQPSAGNLQALVSATNGANIPDAQAAKIASIVGASGGFVPLNDSGLYQAGQAYGSYGGWVLPTAGYTVAGGHPAGLVSYNSGQTASNYLYRNAVPGQPQLNRMNTALNMGTNDVNNAGTINASAVKVPSGNNLRVGNSIYYGDGLNSAIRQDGGLYIQNMAGTSEAPLYASTVQVAAGDNLRVGSSSYYGDGQASAIRQDGGVYLQHHDGSAANIGQVGSISSSANDWALLGRDANWGDNSAPQSSVGSAYLNDVYLRSVGRWASQSQGFTYVGSCTTPESWRNTTYCKCNATENIMIMTGYVGSGNWGDFIKCNVDGQNSNSVTGSASYGASVSGTCTFACFKQ
jgi:hypothetical protein